MLFRSCNIGGIIVDSATMETERLASVSPQSASALLRYALPRVEFGLMYYASGAIASEMSEAVEIYFSAIGLTPQSVDDLPKRAEAFDEPIVKIVLITDEREVRGLTESLAAAFDDMQFIQSTAPLLQRLRAVRPELNPALIECVARGEFNGTGLKAVADYYGLDMSEVIAIGDSYNDVAMIKAAGMGVATANAPEPIKNLADYVTDTNNADGVAKAIEKLCFGEP